MATMTGENLLQSIIESTSLEVNTLIRLTLSAKLQQMIENGTYSKLAAGIAMSAFSTTLNGAIEILELSDAVEVNAALIEATAEDEVDQIVFPTVGDGGDEPHETITADIGTITDRVFLDAAQGSFLFTDDASVETFVVVSNFTADDVINVTNAVDGNYSFTNDGEDVIISYNNVGVVNEIKLAGVVTANDLIYDEATFEAVMGFDAFVIV
jgi:hypothetical protein